MKKWLFILITVIATQGWAESDHVYLPNNRSTVQQSEKLNRFQKFHRGVRKFLGLPVKDLKGGEEQDAGITRVAHQVPNNMPLFIDIDKNPKKQEMKVYQRDANGVMQLIHTWPVSTGANVPAYNFKNPNFQVSCKLTPTSPEDQNFTIDPDRLKPVHNSTQWSGANMYNSIFLGSTPSKSGIAIHGIDPALEPNLGKPASGGCIRISKANSNTLMALVQESIGMKGFDDPDFKSFDPKAVQIRIKDSSSAEWQQKIKNDCERENIVNRCVKSKLQTYYPIDSYAAETPQEAHLRQDHEANAPTPDSSAIHGHIEFPVGNTYPDYLAEEDKYDHAQATAWLNQGHSFNYTRKYVYSLKNGQLDKPKKAFRVYHIPDKLVAGFIEECRTAKADELANFDKKQNKFSIPPELVPIPTPRPQLENESTAAVR